MRTESDELAQIGKIKAQVERWMEREFGKINWTELARRMGVRQSTIARLASGESFPSIPTLLRLAHATGQSVDWLLQSRAVEEEPTAGRPGEAIAKGNVVPGAVEVPDSLAKLIRVWAKLPPEDRRAVEEHAEALLVRTEQRRKKTARMADLAELFLDVDAEPDEPRRPRKRRE